jgi:hypothetical protein
VILTGLICLGIHRHVCTFSIADHDRLFYKFFFSDFELSPEARCPTVRNANRSCGNICVGISI